MAAGEATGLEKTIVSEAPAAALTVDKTQEVGVVPFDGKVVGVTFVPEAAITGANTDTRTLTIVNAGQDGTGTTNIATLAFTSGVNGVAFDEKAYTLNATAANLVVAAGDVIKGVSAHGGSTGLADPGGEVRVTIDRS